ncbi:MAG: thiamine phosphate synthase [Lachnospiraceae bacterium]|nr:thiamine phosphate synthase [Lachnospiraceae bacterium]
MGLLKRDLGLVAVTDLSSMRVNKTLRDAAQEAIEGGVTMVVLNEPTLPHDALMKEAVRLKILCGMHDIPFIMMRHVDIADAVDADGIVVAYEEFDPVNIRAVLGADRSIGVLVSKPEEAEKSAEGGASFLMCGPVNDKHDKDKPDSITTDELEAVCAVVDIPVIAYGGLEDINMLRGTGISGIGAATSIFGQSDVTAAASSLRKLTREIL